MTIDLFDKAFKLLRRNYGSPGLDGISLKEVKKNYSRHKNILSSKYNRGEINSLPIKTTTIIDYGGQEREIFVYCIYERWLQMYLKLQIEPSIEKNLKDYVFGYRKDKTMEDLRNYMIKTGVELVLHLDIVKYFEQIDKEQLFAYLGGILGVDRDILVKLHRSVSHVDTGLPQGNVLSPILSNTYLMSFDELFPERYARFSDDLYFALDTLEEKDSVIEKVSAQLLKLNLKINYNKLEITNVNEL